MIPIAQVGSGEPQIVRERAKGLGSSVTESRGAREQATPSGFGQHRDDGEEEQEGRNVQLKSRDPQQAGGEIFSTVSHACTWNHERGHADDNMDLDQKPRTNLPAFGWIRMKNRDSGRSKKQYINTIVKFEPMLII